MIRQHSGRVFGGNVENPEAKAELLRHATRCNWELYELPTLDDVQNNSAQASDGVRHSAWQASGRSIVEERSRGECAASARPMALKDAQERRWRPPS